MAEDGTELEKVPLAEGTSSSDPQILQSGIPQIVMLDEDSRPSTSGKSVPAINWGDRKVSPNDLEVMSCMAQSYVECAVCNNY